MTLFFFFGEEPTMNLIHLSVEYKFTRKHRKHVYHINYSLASAPKKLPRISIFID